jgi:1-acylglycerone phosphate reductase
MKSNKKTILITGCSDGGLGSALALQLHKSGWRVFASARNLTKLSETDAAGIESIQLDVNSLESVTAAVAKVSELTGGTLDALLNNAGAGHSMPVLDLDLVHVREMFELNVFSLITVTRESLPLLLKSSHGGMVINNTSIVSMMPLPFQGAYTASKAAAASLNESLRLELAPFGIKVVELKTGVVATKFFENSTGEVLPLNSRYSVAKDAVESVMAGTKSFEEASDRNAWATDVVKELEKHSPPYQIWKGRYALSVRLSSHLPTGFLDSMVKKQGGIDVLEKKIQEQGGLAKFKQA